MVIYLKGTANTVSASVMQSSIPRNPSMNIFPATSRTVATILSIFLEGIVSLTSIH